MYIPKSSQLYQSLVGQTQMLSWGLDLAARPYKMLQESFGQGLVYALLVVALGVLYFVQQKMVAARATVAPTMSPTQQKLMQYLPVVFAVFLFFYLTGLVIYYMAQAIFRIGLQYYITRKFYHGDQSLGRQAIAAGDEARELAKKDGGTAAGACSPVPSATWPTPRASRRAKGGSAKKELPPAEPVASKRVTQPKGKPTATRPASSGRASRPAGRVRRRPRRSRRSHAMEWVETTARTVEEAKELALDQLGVAEDDAEIVVVDEPKSGLFGRLRGEARVRARVRPTQARQKVDHRERRKSRAVAVTKPVARPGPPTRLPCSPSPRRRRPPPPLPPAPANGRRPVQSSPIGDDGQGVSRERSSRRGSGPSVRRGARRRLRVAG